MSRAPRTTAAALPANASTAADTNAADLGLPSQVTQEPPEAISVVIAEPAAEPAPEIPEQTRLEMEAGRAALQRQQGFISVAKE